MNDAKFAESLEEVEEEIFRNNEIFDKVLEEVIKELTVEEREIIRDNVQSFDSITSSTPDKRKILLLTLRSIVKGLMEREQDKRNLHYIDLQTRNLDHTVNVKKKIKDGFVEYGSFVEVIENDKCRTSQSIPRKGYTSVSRIATGCGGEKTLALILECQENYAKDVLSKKYDSE